MTEFVLAILFLAVSVESVIVQGRSLWKILQWRYEDTGDHRLVHGGMLRTATCRVIAASIYVCVAIADLIAQQTFQVLALVVFSFIQLLWQGNAVADVRLRQELAEKDVLKP